MAETKAAVVRVKEGRYLIVQQSLSALYAYKAWSKSLETAELAMEFFGTRTEDTVFVVREDKKYLICTREVNAKFAEVVAESGNELNATKVALGIAKNSTK